jgi:hypothetical protein
MPQMMLARYAFKTGFFAELRQDHKEALAYAFITPFLIDLATTDKRIRTFEAS